MRRRVDKTIKSALVIGCSGLSTCPDGDIDFENAFIVRWFLVCSIFALDSFRPGTGTFCAAHVVEN